MCQGPSQRDKFFARGHDKGWSDDRIRRAWDAQEQRSALKDAEEIMAAPEALQVGDRVNVAHGAYTTYAATSGAKIIAIDGVEAWVKLANGDRHTIALRHLQRAPAAENAARPAS